MHTQNMLRAALERTKVGAVVQPLQILDCDDLVRLHILSLQ
jgi:hypothetical protein